MRWSAYLASQPPEKVASLLNDLTAGYGTLAFMVRQLTRDGELREVVGALDRAEASLDRAYRGLALQPNRLPLPPPVTPALGQPWQAYMRNRPVDDGAALLAWLQDAVAQARVAGEVLATDGMVEEIAIHLRAALDQLQALRAAISTRD